MVDGFHRLRHDAVVGRHHQHHDVRHLGAAGAHGGERLVAGRVDEGHLAAGGHGHLVGADVLRDAAGLARRDVGRADGVEQRRLAVIDVAHDGDHGRTRLERTLVGLGGADQALFDVGFRHALGRVAELAHDQFRRVGIDHVVDLVHGSLRHEELDHVHGTLGHAVREFLDRDHLGDDHFAHDLVSRLYDSRLAHLFALAAALQRGQRTFALCIVEGVVDGELHALAAVVARALDRSLHGLVDAALLLRAQIVVALGLGLDAALGGRRIEPLDDLGTLGRLERRPRRALRLDDRRATRIIAAALVALLVGFGRQDVLAQMVFHHLSRQSADRATHGRDLAQHLDTGRF